MPGASGAQIAQQALQAAALAALQGQGWQGAWSSTISYFTGAIVEYNGVVYVALQAAVGQTPPNLNNEPDTSPTFWQVTGTQQFLGNWDSSVSYTPGAEVIDVTGGGGFYVCLVTNTNKQPS